MRTVAIWTSVATIVALNVVIGLGLLGLGDAAMFRLMLTALHVVLPISSCLMLTLLVRDRQWPDAAVFAAVVAGMLVVGALDLTSVTFSRGLHLITDLCALNLYLFAVPRLLQRERLSRTPP
jgi:hypothetical protein